MVGSAIAGGLAIGSALAGGITSMISMRNMRNNLEQQQRENKNWYERRYNEDATQRGDAQRVWNMTTEALRDRNRVAQGTAAVAGGTEEGVAAAKEASNRALAEAASRIVAQGDARKDDIERQYMANRTNISNQQNQMEANKAGAIAGAIGGVANAAGSLGEAIDNYRDRQDIINLIMGGN